VFGVIACPDLRAFVTHLRARFGVTDSGVIGVLRFDNSPTSGPCWTLQFGPQLGETSAHEELRSLMKGMLDETPR
jgi:hypothetical protein